MKVTLKTGKNDYLNHTPTSPGMTYDNIYGAFELKRIYSKNYLIGVGIAVALHLCLALIFLVFTPKEKTEKNKERFQILNYVELGPPPSIVSDDYFTSAARVKPTYGTPKIAKKGEETTDLEMPKESSVLPSNVKVEAPKPVEKKIEPPVDETYYVAVDMMPEPFGGMEAIQKNVNYPDAARKESIVGKVFVKAFINENGEVTRAEIVKGLGYGCDEEALWAVKSMRFRPGKKNGIRVKVQFTLAVSFRPN